MRKPYDFLATDKEPFLYVEKSIVCMDDGFLTTLSGKEGKRIIAPASHLVMLLGSGTSITQEAAIFSAQNDMQISFVRGGSNIHSIFQEGRYPDPERLVNQINNQKQFKLEISKSLMKTRFYLLGLDFDQDVDKKESIAELTLLEARWAKSKYRELCIKHKVNGFKRDFNGTDIVNERLNILNNALYSLCTAIALSCHLSPSIGFIHGFSRRGGLAFDLADLIKTRTTVDMSFTNLNSDMKVQDLMYVLMARLKTNHSQLFRLLIDICLMLGEDEYSDKKWLSIYDHHHIKQVQKAKLPLNEKDSISSPPPDIQQIEYREYSKTSDDSINN